MILSDNSIAQYCDHTSYRKMIVPFYDHQVRTLELGDKTIKIPSFGLSSYGYDVRLQPTFKLFNKPNDGRIIDVLNFEEEEMVELIEADSVIIPPGGLLLGVTMERFQMPEDVTGVCVGKSTWARLGAHVLVTPLEAGWSGELVVEIANVTNLPLKIYAGVGIAQIQFFKGDKYCKTPYNSRDGKYDNQVGVTTAKL